jgi:hypothetical protein
MTAQASVEEAEQALATVKAAADAANLEVDSAAKDLEELEKALASAPAATEKSAAESLASATSALQCLLAQLRGNPSVDPALIKLAEANSHHLVTGFSQVLAVADREAPAAPLRRRITMKRAPPAPSPAPTVDSGKRTCKRIMKKGRPVTLGHFFSRVSSMRQAAGEDQGEISDMDAADHL